MFMGWGQVYWLALGSGIGGCDFYIRRSADVGVRDEALPDLAGLLLDHGLAGFAAEGLLELGDVGHYAVDAGVAGEWGLVRALTRRFSGRSFSQAHWAMPTQKRWSGVKPSRVGQGLAGGLLLPGDVGEEGAADVGYVLAAGEFGVDVDVVDDDVLRVLVADAVDAIFEVLGVGVGSTSP